MEKEGENKMPEFTCEGRLRPSDKAAGDKRAKLGACPKSSDNLGNYKNRCNKDWRFIGDRLTVGDENFASHTTVSSVQCRE